MRDRPVPPVDRRTFLSTLAGLGAAAAATACASGGATGAPGTASRAAAGAPAWRDRIGLQLFTVRDRTATDYPGTLLGVAKLGFREVQTTGSYGQLTATQIKSYLDAAGLACTATHVSPPAGADFERTLEGYAMIGHRYTTVRLGGGGRPAGGAPPQRPAGGGPRQQTLEEVKRTAAQLNEAGRVTRKHGLKVIVHNHTEEFAPLADSPLLPYDVLIAETDPSLVALELDIGWAAVAGQSALELFRKAPGRFEVWHVKDIANLAALRALGTQAERQRAARIVPLGEGEIDYAAIFAQAARAGMQYYYVEQDSAPQSGDSLAAAATSYRNLRKIVG